MAYSRLGADPSSSASSGRLNSHRCIRFEPLDPCLASLYLDPLLREPPHPDPARVVVTGALLLDGIERSACLVVSSLACMHPMGRGSPLAQLHASSRGPPVQPCQLAGLLVCACSTAGASVKSGEVVRAVLTRSAHVRVKSVMCSSGTAFVLFACGCLSHAVFLFFIVLLALCREVSLVPVAVQILCVFFISVCFSDLLVVVNSSDHSVFVQYVPLARRMQFIIYGHAVLACSSSSDVCGQICVTMLQYAIANMRHFAALSFFSWKSFAVHSVTKEKRPSLLISSFILLF